MLYSVNKVKNDSLFKFLLSVFLAGGWTVLLAPGGAAYSPPLTHLYGGILRSIHSDTLASNRYTNAHCKFDSSESHILFLVKLNVDKIISSICGSFGGDTSTSVV